MKSLWQDRTDLPAFPRLEGDLKTDVLIIGGGLAGVLCAYFLDRAGVDYALVERRRILSGVTSGTTAKITSQHGLIYDKLIRRFGLSRARLYYEANQQALARYRELCRSVSCGFQERDAYVYSRESVMPLEREAAAVRKLGGRAELAEGLPLPFSTAGAVRFPGQAQFDPFRFCQAIVPGLRIYEHTAVTAYDGVDFMTETGRLQGKKVIVATHFPIFNKHGAYFLKLYQQRAYVIGLENAPKVGGMYLDGAKGGLSFRDAGDLLLLGGESHRTGGPTGGWAALEKLAADFYPGAKVRYRWAAQDCVSLDGVPYIGAYSPRTPDLFVATGFNKWGMTGSMAAADLLCDLARGRKNPYAALFDPGRTILRPQLFSNAVHAAGNLLTPTRPRCPHMGCALKWNRQEHSWDCPCHGSRFDEKGVLLSDPAMGDLKSR